MIIHIQPIPKGRPRTVSKNGRTWTYTPPRTKEFEEKLKWLLKQGNPKPYDCPLSLTVSFGYKRDADIDNFIKAFCDAANGILWNDDRQIREIHACKRKEDSPYIYYDLLSA